MPGAVPGAEAALAAGVVAPPPEHPMAAPARNANISRLSTVFNLRRLNDMPKISNAVTADKLPSARKIRFDPLRSAAMLGVAAEAPKV